MKRTTVFAMIVGLLAGTWLVSVPAKAHQEAPGSGVGSGSPATKPTRKWLHGFRVGYTYFNVDVTEEPSPPVEGEQDNPRLRSPHMFVVGYELTQRWLGGSWLNVITVENVLIGGINQNLVLPSANLLLGFEMYEQLQLGVGANITPLDPDGKNVHMVIAAGYTPKVGKFYVPLHVAYIPDVDNHFRVALTTGVNW